MARAVFKLCVDRCPTHRFSAVSLQSPDGTGLRLTYSKCCGTWETVKRFDTDPWRLAVDILSEARGLTQEQRFDLEDRIRSLIPERDESFVRPRKEESADAQS
jgi:hypothetical protein